MQSGCQTDSDVSRSAGAQAASGWSGNRAPGLDLLRAAAIISVMLYHLSSHGISVPLVGAHGWMGVDLFFVLSGYLVASQLLRRVIENRPEHGRFYVDRALRILPAYLAVLAIYLLLPVGREGGGMQPLWKFITFTVNLWPDWSRGTAFSHAWSLCVEAHFYLLLPVVLWLLTRRANGATAVGVAIGVVAGGMALRAWLWLEQVAPHLGAGDSRSALIQFVAMIYNPSWARLDGLVCGVALAALKVFRPLPGLAS